MLGWNKEIKDPEHDRSDGGRSFTKALDMPELKIAVVNDSVAAPCMPGRKKAVHGAGCRRRDSTSAVPSER